MSEEEFYPKDKNGVTLKVGMKIKVEEGAGLSEPLRRLAGCSDEVRLGEIVKIEKDGAFDIYLAYANGSFNPKRPMKHWECEVIGGAA